MDIHDIEIRVNDVYLNENWNFNSLYTNIPQVIYDLLKALPNCLNHLVSDRLTWKDNLDGIYIARDGITGLIDLNLFIIQHTIILGSGCGIFLLLRR